MTRDELLISNGILPGRATTSSIPHGNLRCQVCQGYKGSWSAVCAPCNGKGYVPTSESGIEIQALVKSAIDDLITARLLAAHKKSAANRTNLKAAQRYLSELVKIINRSRGGSQGDFPMMVFMIDNAMAHIVDSVNENFGHDQLARYTDDLLQSAPLLSWDPRISEESANQAIEMGPNRRARIGALR